MNLFKSIKIFDKTKFGSSVQMSETNLELVTIANVY